MGCITKQKRNKRTYYPYSHSYREKMDQGDSGKVRGTGKSRVRTMQVWLGTAEQILARFEENPQEAVAARSFDFGIPVAAWDMAQRLARTSHQLSAVTTDMVPPASLRSISLLDVSRGYACGVFSRKPRIQNHLGRFASKPGEKSGLGLVDILDRWMPKRKQGLSTGQVMVLTAISRLGGTPSKQGLGDWYAGTSLWRILGDTGKELDSAAWWREADRVMPEKKLTEAKKKAGYERGEKIPWKEWEKIFDGEVLEHVEQEIWERVAVEYNLPLDVVLYDLTNFYTFDADTTPTSLLEYGQNKQGRNNKLQVGLALGCLKELGIPLMHTVYAGHETDVTLFPTALRTLVKRYEAVSRGTEKLLLVIDGGNNSRRVYEAHEGLPVDYVGVLKRSDHRDLMDVGLEQYKGSHRGRVYHKTEKQVYGRDCRIVVTYTEQRKAHELRGFNHRIEVVKKELRKLWRQHWDQESREKTRGRMDQLLREQKVLTSQARRYLEYEIEGGRLSVRRKKFECREKKRQFGKRVLFTNRKDMNPEEMIDLDARILLCVGLVVAQALDVGSRATGYGDELKGPDTCHGGNPGGIPCASRRDRKPCAREEYPPH